MYIESHVVAGLCQIPYYDPGGGGWGFDDFMCPMGGELDNQLGQISILAPPWPRGVGVGHSIDRHITLSHVHVHLYLIRLLKTGFGVGKDPQCQ